MPVSIPVNDDGYYEFRVPYEGGYKVVELLADVFSDEVGTFSNPYNPLPELLTLLQRYRIFPDYHEMIEAAINDQLRTTG